MTRVLHLDSVPFNLFMRYLFTSGLVHKGPSVSYLRILALSLRNNVCMLGCFYEGLQDARSKVLNELSGIIQGKEERQKEAAVTMATTNRLVRSKRVKETCEPMK